MTALIGANGAGKSAFIEALRRLFGLTREERTLTRADVHFGPRESPDTVAERQVVIDVVFAFPELAQQDADAIRTVPEVFRVMTAAGPGESLKARIRLEALWKRGESFIDEIEAALYWITHLNEVEFGEDGGAGLDKQRVHNSDRGKVQLIHVPATRDGGAVTRQALRQLLRRLERSGDFGLETKGHIQEVSETLQEKMEELPAIEWVTDKLAENWDRLHTAAHLRNPRLVVLSQEFTQLLRSLTAKLSPTPDGRERGLDELSEGQTSLFFLALAATLAQLESELAKGTPPNGFTDLDVAPPALTIYAVEEPENHLAPFYLSRLMGLLGELCAGHQNAFFGYRNNRAEETNAFFVALSRAKERVYFTRSEESGSTAQIRGLVELLEKADVPTIAVSDYGMRLSRYVRASMRGYSPSLPLMNLPGAIFRRAESAPIGLRSQSSPSFWRVASCLIKTFSSARRGCGS